MPSVAFPFTRTVGTICLLLCGIVAEGRANDFDNFLKPFFQQNCTKCHVLRGQGIGVVDLTDVSERKSRRWIRDQIVNPRMHDEHPGMPSFAHLSLSEVEALIDYIEGE